MTAADSSMIVGIKKSWQAARELHKYSKNPRSGPEAARGFLARHPQRHGPAHPTVQRAYDTYLLTHRKRRRRRRAAASLKIAIPATDNQQQMSDVRNLFKVKMFLDQHQMSIPIMRKMLDVLQQLSH